MSGPFCVGITRDFLKPDGSLGFGDIGLDVLEGNESIEWEYLKENTSELSVEDVQGYDAMLVLAPRVTAQTLAAERLKIVARFGVGYDNVDVEACTQNGVLLTITPDGVRRPVAMTVITLLLALTHKLLIKDKMVREDRWSDKLDHVGLGVTGKTLGIVGLGNIGREVAQLAAPMGLRLIAYDPFLSPETAVDGVELTSFDKLMSTADYVCICCALTDDTHHLINAEQLGRMKPSAYLINVARGPIVDQTALTEALRNQSIQGAGLDVFEKEPPDPDDPLLTLENVILSPHALCWTDECFSGNGRSACQAIVDVAEGRLPRYIVNNDVIGSSQLRADLV